MQQIYLAGYDVFRADAAEHGERLKALCLENGYKGLYPLDNLAPSHLQGPKLAQWIFEANIALLQQADLVMANLNPFRGAEPDSGTVFEVGYAVAHGVPVWGYTRQARPLTEQVPGSPKNGVLVDKQGYTIEDFGLNLNLMLACSVQVVQGDAQNCLQAIVEASSQGTPAN